MSTASRGQSHVVGVALLLAITIISMSVLTMSVGTLIDAGQSRDEHERVGTALERLNDPSSPDRTSLTATIGTISTAPREITVSTSTGADYRFETTAIVYTNGHHRVSTLCGAVISGQPGNAWFRSTPRVFSPESASVRLIRLTAISTSGFDRLQGAHTFNRQRSRTHHSHDTLTGSLSIETATPGPFERFFRARGYAPSREDPDSDGIPSVSVSFTQKRRTILMIRNITVEDLS
ncbi:DUF7289 family protein [Halocatena halophila]|uniref:DUF7289 family protein n=1 Tax=Halocatena halophila TaxID=2814576 RepID=UPI002ED06DF4